MIHQYFSDSIGNRQGVSDISFQESSRLFRENPPGLHNQAVRGTAQISQAKFKVPPTGPSSLQPIHASAWLCPLFGMKFPRKLFQEEYVDCFSLDNICKEFNILQLEKRERYIDFYIFVGQQPHFSGICSPPTETFAQLNIQIIFRVNIL